MLVSRPGAKPPAGAARAPRAPATGARAAGDNEWTARRGEHGGSRAMRAGSATTGRADSCQYCGGPNRCGASAASWNSPAGTADRGPGRPLAAAVMPCPRSPRCARDRSAAHPLAAGAEELGMIEILKSVPVRLRARDVLHECDDRHRRLQCFGEPGDEQRGRRSVLPRHDRHLVRYASVAVRHRCARVLGPVSDLPDAEFRPTRECAEGRLLAADLPRHAVAVPARDMGAAQCGRL